MRTIMVNVDGYVPAGFVEIEDFVTADAVLSVDNEDVYADLDAVAKIISTMPTGSRVLVRSEPTFRLFEKQ